MEPSESKRHRACCTRRGTLATSATPAAVAAAAVPANSAPSTTTGVPTFSRRSLRASNRRQLPATPVDLLQPGEPAADAAAHTLPTVAQMLHIALDSVAGQSHAAGAPLLPAPSVAPAPLLLPPAPTADSPLHGLVIGTRFWSTSAADLAPLQQFLSASLPLCSHVIIALNIAADAADTIGFVQSLGVPAERLTLLPVTPWIGVSSGLNAIALHAAAKLNATRLLFQSIEVRLTSAQLLALVHEFDAHPTQLVVGPVLDGHAFEETPRSASLHRVDGHNAPWNTAALWHLPTLLQTGFLTLADGFPRGVHQFGQEEVPTMVMLQAMARAEAVEHPTQHAHAPVADVHRSAITLLHVGEVEWAHSFASASARQQWHAQKMQSKLSRAAHHLRLIGMDGEGNSRIGGRVAHRIATLHREQKDDADTEQQTSQQQPSDGTEVIVAAAAESDPASVLSPSARSSYALPPAAVAAAAAVGSAPRFPSGVNFQAQPAQVAAKSAALPETSESDAPESKADSAAPVLGGAPTADAAVSPDAAAAAPSIPVIPLPSRLHRKIVAAHASAALRSAAASARRVDHSADERMQVKLKHHIPIGRRRR